MSGAAAPGLRLPVGHHLLRWTVLTPLNCGDAAGSAAVDRPVALDTWRRVPYLPASSLKGVLAGRLGNVHQSDGAPNRERQALFGAPDPDDLGAGRGAPVILGDGELLAFPVVLGNGRRARVVPVATLHRLAALGLVEAPSLARVPRDDAFSTPLAAAALPALRIPLAPARLGVPEGLLAALCGGDGPFLVAAPGAAAELWRAASEQRTLTALGPDRRVEQGSLRTVELIPADAVFVSVVSNLTQREADLGPAAPWQLGAWESVGLGYVHATGLEAPVGPFEASAEARPADYPAQQRDRPHEVMRRVFLAVEALHQNAGVGKRVRSAVLDLGPRLRIRGMPATLAFCLAKAGGGEVGEEGADEPGGGDGPDAGSGTAARAAARMGEERRAYRWLLRQLFALPEDASHEDLVQPVVAAISDAKFLPADFDTTRLWLRRYADSMLPKEDDDG